MLDGSLFLHDDLDILADHFSCVVAKDPLGGRAEGLYGPFFVDRNYANRACLDDLRYSLFAELEVGLNFLQVFILREQLGLVTLDIGNVCRYSIVRPAEVSRVTVEVRPSASVSSRARTNCSVSPWP